MKIVALQENVSSALTTASKFVPAKSTSLPALSNFLLTAEKETISIAATDLETAIEVTLSGKVEKEGRVLLPAKTGLSLISALQGGKVTLSTKGTSVVIESSSSSVVLRSEKASDFPDLPLGTKGEGVELGAGLIEDIQKKVAFAASSDQTRAVLNGVLFDVGDDSVSLVATDGFRLALLKRKKTEKGIQKPLLLPAKVVQALFTVSKGEDSKLKIHVAEGGSQVVFVRPGVRIASRVIEGTFPEYQRIVPQESSSQAVVDTGALHQAVRFASVLARESSNIVRLNFQSKKVVVSANAPQTGENSTSVEAALEGDPVEVAFNFRFLIDFLQLELEKQVVFETKGALSPGVFRYDKNPEYTYIVMPVRLQDAQ